MVPTSMYREHIRRVVRNGGSLGYEVGRVNRRIRAKRPCVTRACKGTLEYRISGVGNGSTSLVAFAASIRLAKLEMELKQEWVDLP